MGEVEYFLFIYIARSGILPVYLNRYARSGVLPVLFK